MKCNTLFSLCKITRNNKLQGPETPPLAMLCQLSLSLLLYLFFSLLELLLRINHQITTFRVNSDSVISLCILLFFHVLLIACNNNVNLSHLCFSTFWQKQKLVSLSLQPPCLMQYRAGLLAQSGQLQESNKNANFCTTL